MKGFTEAGKDFHRYLIARLCDEVQLAFQNSRVHAYGQLQCLHSRFKFTIQFHEQVKPFQIILEQQMMELSGILKAIEHNPLPPIHCCQCHEEGLHMDTPGEVIPVAQCDTQQKAAKKICFSLEYFI